MSCSGHNSDLRLHSCSFVSLRRRPFRRSPAGRLFGHANLSCHGGSGYGAFGRLGDDGDDGADD